MEAIETTDIWKVTHKEGNAYLIHSDTYTDRWCRFLAKVEPNGAAGGSMGWLKSNCSPDYLYDISVTLDGTVRGGWKLLHNPKRVLFAHDRYTDMRVDFPTTEDWGPQPLFVPLNRDATHNQ